LAHSFPRNRETKKFFVFSREGFLKILKLKKFFFKTKKSFLKGVFIFGKTPGKI
jgi:hypothetical protein